MKFGLAIMNDFAPDISPHERIPQMREQVVAARHSGISSVWLLNHYLGNMQTLQPVPTLAALAEHAGDMSVGTNMFILPLHEPVDVAEQFATLDQISGGRTIAGFGMGYRSNEYEAFGLTMDDRVKRYEESVEIIRALWRGENVDFEGEHFAVRGEHIGIPPVQTAGPPIWVGAGVHKTGASRAARLGDAWIIPPHAPLDKLLPIIDFYKSERQRLGRNPAQEIVVRRELVLKADADAAYELGANARAANSAMYAAFEAPDKTDAYKHLRDDSKMKETVDHSYIFTNPDKAIESLKELEANGITYVILRMQWFDLPQSDVMQTMELFRDHVLPEFV